MFLKENYFILLYSCFEAFITLSEQRWEILWVLEKYFLSSRCFKTCLKKHMHAEHTWKWDGRRSPTLSKVQTTVPATARFDEQVTTGMLGCGFTAHELLPQELPTHVLQPRSKWQVTSTGRVKHLCLRTQGCVLAGLREQLVRWKVAWPFISPLLRASALKKGQGSTLVAAEVLKNSFQPKNLNWPWINRSLSGNAAVTERLYVDHGSATLHKWDVRLHVFIPNQ